MYVILSDGHPPRRSRRSPPSPRPRPRDSSMLRRETHALPDLLAVHLPRHHQLLRGWVFDDLLVEARDLEVDHPLERLGRGVLLDLVQSFVDQPLDRRDVFSGLGAVAESLAQNQRVRVGDQSFDMRLAKPLDVVPNRVIGLLFVHRGRAAGAAVLPAPFGHHQHKKFQNRPEHFSVSLAACAA